MATIRERRPGVWEVRVFTGSDARGRPTQLSRPVRGGKREASLVCHRNHGVTEFRARELCLSTIVERLQNDAVPHLVLESRHDDREDHLTVPRARRVEPPLIWEHRVGAEEPLLWIADGITWAVGAGAAWRQVIDPFLGDQGCAVRKPVCGLATPGAQVSGLCPSQQGPRAYPSGHGTSSWRREVRARVRMICGYRAGGDRTG